MRLELIEEPLSFGDINQFGLAMMAWHMRVHLEQQQSIPGGVMVSLRRGRSPFQVQGANIETAILAGMIWLIRSYPPDTRRAVYA